MAPRSIGTIFSEISAAAENEQCDIYQLFKDKIDEIFSHPKDDILSHLVHLTDKDCYMLREKLLVECLDKLAANEIAVSDGTGIAVSGSSGMEIRRRYKINLVYDDIYIIGLSYTNLNPHKELGKLICAQSSKQRKSVATAHDTVDTVETYADAAKTDVKAAAPPPNPPSKSDPAKIPPKVQVKGAGKTTTNTATPVVPQDILTKILSSMSELKLSLAGVRNENKELKNTLGLVCTKLDKQYKEYSQLKKDHEQLKSTVKDMKAVAQPPKQMPLHQGTAANLLNVINARTARNEAQTPSLGATAAPVNASTIISNALNAPPPTTVHQNRQRNNGSALSTRPKTTAQNNGNRENTGATAPMFGTKEAQPNRSIAGPRVVKNFTLFIGGVDLKIDEQGLGDHIVQEFNVEPIDIEINKTNRYNRSFKVVMKLEDKDCLLVPDKWENNIIIKPFKTKHYHLDTNQQQQQQRNQNRNQRNRREDQQQHGKRLNQTWRDNLDKPFSSRWDDDVTTTRPVYEYPDLNESNPWL